MGFLQDLLKNKYVNRFIQPQVNAIQKTIPRAREVFQPVRQRVQQQFLQSLPTPQNYRMQVRQPIINTYNRMVEPARQQYPTLAKVERFTNKLPNVPRNFLTDVGRSMVRNPVSLLSRETLTPTTKAEKLLLGNEPVIPAEKSWGAQQGKKLGLSDKQAALMGVGLTLTGTVMDVTGAGGVEKKLAKEVTEQGVRKILGKEATKYGDDVIRAIAKEKNPKVIRDLVNSKPSIKVAPNVIDNGARMGVNTPNGRVNTVLSPQEQQFFRNEVQNVIQTPGKEVLHLDGSPGTIKASKQLSREQFLKLYPEAQKSFDKFANIKGEVKTPLPQMLSKEKAGITPKAVMPELPRTSQVLPESQLNKKISSFEQSLTQNGINVNRLNISNTAKKRISKEINDIKPQIESKVGAKLTNQEAVTLAENSSKTLNNAAGREQTKQWEAALLKTRQQLAASAKSNTIDKAFIENLKTVKALATDTARKLQSFSIDADPINATPKQAILEAILKVNDNTDEILKAAKGVNFDDANQATNFYRTFVKPKAGDWIDLIRYNSMLSSPLTHIKNIATNALQSIIVKPVEKTLTGVVDIFSKKPTNFPGEGVAYTVGLHKSWGAATRKFADVMSGKAGITNLDMKYIPPSTGKGTKFLSFPTKLLDGMDQFFTTLASGGEKSALNLKIKKGVKIGGNIDELAKEKAAYTVFREKLGNTEQGYLLDGIDKVTGVVEKLRQNENPLISTVAKFTLPFVRTPMNIFKQGLEYSPAGFTTAIGANNISEQISKALIGTAVFGGAATLIGSGRLTWGEPINEKQKNEFRAAGMQPYAVKIGNKWVAYKYLGPLAFPLAMAAAIDYEMKNGRMDDSTGERILGMVARYGTFLADQSYAKSMGDLLKAVGGDESGIARVVSNYPQQLIPLRALGGWLARITDPNQRKISKDANFIEKQTQLLMQNIPGLSQKLETRPDTFGNPIPNQNRVVNAFSPLSITTENPLGKDIYNSSEAKRAENRQITDLKKGQGGTTESGKTVKKIGDEWKTFKTPEEADFAVAKDEFSKSGKNFQIQGNKVFRLNADGSVKVDTKISYDTLLTTQKMENAKTAKNLDEWGKLYEIQRKNLLTQINDQSLDPLEKGDLEQKLAKLDAEAAKYAGYGGFTKPKAASKAKETRKKAAISSLKSFKVSKFSTPSMPTIKGISAKSGAKTITAAQLASGR